MANYIYPLEAGREAWGSTITPQWTITEQKSASGLRRAISEQVYPLWVIKLSYRALTDAEANALQSFYCQRRGSFEPFYYKDYAHHKINAQKLSSNIDGTYQLVANIGGYTEPVSYAENVKIYVNGIETEFEIDGGKITITGAEIDTESEDYIVTADYDYYLRVHFTGDLTITQAMENINHVSLTLESVR